MTKKLQTNICEEHRYKGPQENETKFNSTLKGSNTMSKWDIPYGWKAASVYTNQLVWHTTLTEQRVKFTATIVNTALCPEAFITRADLMVSVLSTHTADNETSVGDGYLLRWLWYTPANAGDTRNSGSIPGLERSPGGRHSNPLQYSCLENPVDRGPWWALVHSVAESDNTETTHHR